MSVPINDLNTILEGKVDQMTTDISSELLDLILTFLASNPPGDNIGDGRVDKTAIYAYHSKSASDRIRSIPIEVELFVRKLEKDGYITITEHTDEQGKKQGRYKITQDGSDFIFFGGYVNKNIDISNRRAEMESQIIRERYMLVLTAVLTVGTSVAAAFYLLEIRAKYPDFYSAIYPALVSALVALAVTYLVWQRLKNSRQ